MDILFVFFFLIERKFYKVHISTSDTYLDKGVSTSDAKCENTCTIQYVTGQRGSRKIVCGGFSYICAKINGDRKYWVCSKQRSRNCKARLITNGNETVFIRRNQIHNHNSEHSAKRAQND